MTETITKSEGAITTGEVGWSSLELDERIRKAIIKIGWKKPSLIQSRAIPLVLEGRDILAKACTGSGKTAAYLIPVFQRILMIKESEDFRGGVIALILAPSRELCEQISDVVKALKRYLEHIIAHINLSMDATMDVQRCLLREFPDIVVSTPARVVAHLDGGSLTFNESLGIVVIDEADSILSYGYEEDMKKIISKLPENVQGFLASATLNSDIQTLQQLVLHNPIVLRLESRNGDDSASCKLKQYFIPLTSEDDRYICLYALLKFNIITEKILVFVDVINDCYKVKLFLDQFSINSAILNNELPFTSRCHIIQEFNKGMFNVLIATDHAQSAIREIDNDQSEISSNTLKNLQDQLKKIVMEEKRFRKRKSHSSLESDEYGVARGIDFRDVDCVVNFDVPKKLDQYIHRVGRTARGGNSGVAITIFLPKDKSLCDSIIESLNGQNSIQIHHVDPSLLNNFRYRAEDVLRRITRSNIRKARCEELKNEILKSEKLRSYFQKNLLEYKLLKHDSRLAVKVNKNLVELPSYLKPTSNHTTLAMPSRNLAVAQKKVAIRRPRKKWSSDPLKSFEYQTASSFSPSSSTVGSNPFKFTSVDD